jgi:uncharacterized protein YkwD
MTPALYGSAIGGGSSIKLRRPPSRVMMVALPMLAAACSSSGSNGASEHPVSECPGALCGILDAQNAVRASAPSANPALPELTWDETLAGHAQAWADTCPDNHNPNRTVNGQTVGENIYFSSSTTPDSPSSVVGAWAQEGQNYDITTNTCGGSPQSATNLNCGHYTQLV